MKERYFQGAGWPLAVAFAWLWTWRHLSVEWSTNPQYQYGFAVPFLFLFAAQQRWHGPMRPPERYGKGWGRTLKKCLPSLTIAFVISAWLALVLGELLRWQDPIWRFTGGLMVLGSYFLTAAWLYGRGGWPLLRREWFPLGFAWLALPWPMPIELALTQKLLHLVTDITVTAANSLGIAALQRGNLIELANGFVGMANACSGVESFQSSLMASLFLGEFHRLNAGRRCALVAAGWLVAFAANLARVFGLLLVVHSKGQGALAQWHDLCGGMATTITFLSIFGLAVWLSIRPATDAPQPVPPPVPLASARQGWTVCAAFISIPLLVATWFHALPVPAMERPIVPHWQLTLDSLPSGWSGQRLEPSPQERAGLQFSQWDYFLVKTPEGHAAKVIHLFWAPGKSMPSMAFYHTPALCLSSLGWNQIAPPQATTLKVKGEQIQCVRYSLEENEIKYSIFQSLSSGGKTEPFFVDPNQTGDRRARFSMLWKEPCRQVGEEILIYMPTCGNEQSPNAAAEKLLQLILRAPGAR